ncbi:unnamed protein product [Penicillium pancosmium]
MKQRPNFKELPIQPSGLYWENDFVDAEHEQRLISIFTNELKWPDRPDPEIPYKEFPDWLQPLIPTTEDRLPDQVCLQFYPPGAGIPPHVDAHAPYDQLYALSLGAPAMMVFGQGEKRIEVDLNPRSMMQMTGDSRLHWTHGIKKRKTDTLPDGTVRLRENRWSITYRWLREGDCECGNITYCDTAQSRNGTEKEKRSVKALAEKANSEDPAS